MGHCGVGGVHNSETYLAGTRREGVERIKLVEFWCHWTALVDKVVVFNCHCTEKETAVCLLPNWQEMQI